MPALATALGPTFFVIGVWVQPAETMDLWKARGVNTVIEVPQDRDVLAWAKAADSKGLYQIRRPSKDLGLDLKDPYLLAWATMDEPSNTTTKFDYRSVAQEPAKVAQEAAPWRAAAKTAGRFVPIWTNHVGPHIYPDWAKDNVLMRDYMEGPESDWLSNDGYPIQGRQPFVMRTNDGYTSTTQGVSLDRQETWSHGKPTMAFIGVSVFNGGGGAPTAAQFNAMAWSSVIHGAVGVAYFPIRLSPWSFDATPPDVVRALTAFDRDIAAIDNILVDQAAGGRRPSVVFRSANPGARPIGRQLPYPFEAAEIPTPQGPYRIVLNLSDQDQVFDRPEWGLAHVTFHAYEARRAYGPPLPKQKG